MLAAGVRQRSGRLTWWIIGGLVLAFGLFLGFHYLYGSRFVSDEERMSRLKEAVLTQPPVKKELVGQWPNWRGPNWDGISHETNWSTDWPGRGPKRLWKKEIGEGYSAVTVANNRAYTTYRDDDNEVVICWDADSGKQIWRYSYPGQYDQSGRKFDKQYSPGPRATPTVAGNYVYALGATGILHCLSATTGKKIWRRDLIEEFQARQPRWGFASSPLVWGKWVFTNPGGPDGNALVAFDKITGKVAWKNLDDKAGYSTPLAMTALGVDQILFFTSDALVSVSPTSGELNWRFAWETDYDCNIATPIVVANYVFISTGYNKGCAVLEVTKDDSGKLRADRVYEHNQMCNHFASSVYFQGHIYGFNEKDLTCMDFRTGKTIWIEKGYGKGSLLLANGHLIVLGDNGKLAVGKASPDGFKVLSGYKISRERCWTVPVLANGRLYVRDATSVYCLDVRKKTK